MKDFHDLYSLVQLDVLASSLAKKAILLVFQHRKTPLKRLPITFGKDATEKLEKNWTSYRRKIQTKKGVQLPESIEEVILVMNKWLEENAFF